MEHIFQVKEVHAIIVYRVQFTLVLLKLGLKTKESKDKKISNYSLNFCIIIIERCRNVNIARAQTTSIP